MNLGRRPQRHDPEPYQRYRAPLQAKWRPTILERDRYRCRACGWRPKLPRTKAAQEALANADGIEALEVAHITDAVAFVRAAGHHRAVTFSYRWDNLVTLCGPCHRASHAHRVTEELLPRRQKVELLWEQLRKVRGWSSPFAALPPSMVPPALRPARSFHDVMRLSPLVPFPTFAKYASDGGLVFGDEEALPGQRTLATLAPPIPALTPATPPLATGNGG